MLPKKTTYLFIDRSFYMKSWGKYYIQGLTTIVDVQWLGYRPYLLFPFYNHFYTNYRGFIINHKPEDRIFLAHCLNEIARSKKLDFYVTQQEMRELLDSEANVIAFNKKLIAAGIGMVVRHDIKYKDKDVLL